MTVSGLRFAVFAVMSGKFPRPLAWLYHHRPDARGVQFELKADRELVRNLNERWLLITKLVGARVERRAMSPMNQKRLCIFCGRELGRNEDGVLLQHRRHGKEKPRSVRTIRDGVVESKRKEHLRGLTVGPWSTGRLSPFVAVPRRRLLLV